MIDWVQEVLTPYLHYVLPTVIFGLLFLAFFDNYDLASFSRKILKTSFLLALAGRKILTLFKTLNPYIRISS